MPRAGWLGNDVLRHEVERSDRRVREIVEAVIVDRSDIVNTFDEWATRSPAGAGQNLAEGGVRIAGGVVNLLDHSGSTATDPTDVTRTSLPSPRGLPAGSVVLAHEITWGTATPETIEIHQVEFRLDARDVTSLPQNVDVFRCQLFRMVFDETAGAPGSVISLQPITRAVDVLPAGPTVANYSFDFVAAGGQIPTVGSAPVGQRPVTVVIVWALQADGSAATNVALYQENTTAAFTDNGHTLKSWDYAVPADAVEGSFESSVSRFERNAAANQSRIRLVTNTYSPTSFTVDVDLGGVPTGSVEFVGQGDEPPGTSILYEVRNDADTAWVAYLDGQTTDDLAGVGKRQLYELQVTLTPSSAATPTVRRVGVEEVQRWNLDGIAEVSGLEYRVDPVLHVGQIPECVISVARNGLIDYRDAATRLLSENFLAEIQFEVFCGHPDVPRTNWLRHDRWLVLDATMAGPEIRFACISPMDLLIREIPDFNPVPRERTPLQVANRTTKQAYQDVLNASGLPGRYRGPPLEGTTVVSKRITGSRAKSELDALALIDDAFITSVQGRVTAVSAGALGGVYEFFDAGQVEPLDIPLGARARVEEVFVPYDFIAGADEFAAELRAADPTAIVRLGQTYADSFERIPDSTAEWIRDLGTASALGLRLLERLAAGLIVWRVRVNTANPARLIGDTVAVEVDRFVGADPYQGATPTPLRGRLIGLGVLVEVGGFWGHDLGIWIQGLRDVRPTGTDLARIGFATPELLDVRLQQADLQARIHWTPNVAVHSVLVFQKEFDLPLGIAADVFAEVVLEEGTSLPRSTTEVLVDRPVGGQIAAVELIPRDALGNQGPSWRALIPPNTLDLAAPIVSIEADETGGIATLTLGIVDEARVTEVSFKAKTGPGPFDVSLPPDGTWTRDLTAPFTKTHTAPLDPKHPTFIAWAVGYTDLDGSTQYVSDLVAFDVDDIAQILSVTVTFTAAGLVVVRAFGDSDVASGLVRVSSAATLADPTVASNDGTWVGTSGEVTTALVIPVSDTVHVKVRGINASGVLGPVLRTAVLRGVGSTTIRHDISPAAFSPLSSTDAWDYDADGNLHPGTASSTVTFQAPVIFQKDVRLIIWHGGFIGTTASDSSTWRLFRHSSNTRTLLDTRSISGPGSVGFSTVLAAPEDIEEGRSYSIECAITQGALGAARLTRAAVETVKEGST